MDQVNNFINFDVRKSVHHHTIQINQPTRCNTSTSLLLDVYVWFNIFRAPPHPSSGACTALGASGWRSGSWSDVGRGLADHDRQRCNRHSPAVKPEAPSAVYAPDDGRGDVRNMLSHT